MLFFWYKQTIQYVAIFYWYTEVITGGNTNFSGSV